MRDESFDMLVDAVKFWGVTKGILPPDGDNGTTEFGSRRFAQYVKFLEEGAELGKAIVNNDINEIQDAFGDVLVTLILLSSLLDQDLVVALGSAYDEIRDRQGKMVNGIFVKD